MPLNEIAKKKAEQFLLEMKDQSNKEQFMKIPDRGPTFSAMAEIFDEDEEWASELFTSGILISILSVYFESDTMPDELKKDISFIINTNISNALGAVRSDDWLKFHKAIRNMIWEIYRKI